MGISRKSPSPLSPVNHIGEIEQAPILEGNPSHFFLRQTDRQTDRQRQTETKTETETERERDRDRERQRERRRRKSIAELRLSKSVGKGG